MDGQDSAGRGVAEHPRFDGHRTCRPGHGAVGCACPRVGLSLVRLLGGEPRPLKAYASFGMNGPQRAVEVAAASVEAGFGAIKIKIGYPTLRAALTVVRECRKSIGPELHPVANYNQSLTRPAS